MATSLTSPFCFAEISRWPHELTADSLVSHSIHFADLLPHLKQAKKDGKTVLAAIQKFRLESLHSHFFPVRTLLRYVNTNIILLV